MDPLDDAPATVVIPLDDARTYQTRTPTTSGPAGSSFRPNAKCRAGTSPPTRWTALLSMSGPSGRLFEAEGQSGW
ncbi:hypothetical protein [Streptomyces sp. NPDC050485]|uniref:hypothetical protein n=1 Tax=Streptomyces sp. NPDC050485 TaxID=3365617 RepID=UPI0037A37942